MAKISIDNLGSEATALLKSPQGYILGVVLSQLLAGVESIFLLVLDGIEYVFRGSEPGTTGVLGIADIPLWIGEQLVSAGSAIGGSTGLGSSKPSGILGLFGTINDAILGLANSAGVFGPLIVSAYVAAIAIGGAILLRKLIMVLLDILPGGGGLSG